MIKAVIFDLDDTLISEREYMKSGFYHVSRILCNKLQIEQGSIYRLLLELSSEEPKMVFNRLYDRLGVSYDEEDIVELISEYRNHYPDISFYVDVIPCINKLKKIGIKTGIITDGYAVTQKQKLKKLNAYHYFDEIIITDELGRDYWKPHPLPFEMLRRKLHVEFDQMVYIGDNPQKDFYIREIYPIGTVRIHRNGFYEKNEYYKGIYEKYSINSLNQLIDLVRYKDSNTNYQ